MCVCIYMYNGRHFFFKAYTSPPLSPQRTVCTLWKCWNCESLWGPSHNIPIRIRAYLWMNTLIYTHDQPDTFPEMNTRTYHTHAGIHTRKQTHQQKQTHTYTHTPIKHTPIYIHFYSVKKERLKSLIYRHRVHTHTNPWPFLDLKEKKKSEINPTN